MPYLEQFIAAIKKGKKPIEKLYSGSQWWALTDEAVAYFLQIYETDEAMLESFRHSAIPDEIYIQTVIGSSPFRQRSKPSPMFADFSRSPKPYVFTSADELDMPLASDKLFLRKARLPLNAIASRIKTS